MKIAIISDTHGNYHALRTTLEDVDRWRPDAVVVNGDVVNRGPRSRECWELLDRRRKQLGWQIVGGNHEDYVSRWLDEPVDRDHPRFQIYRSSYYTFTQMGELATAIRDLPFQVEIKGPTGTLLRLTHGTMRGNDDGLLADAPEAELMERIAPAPDVFCTGHTHRPFVRQVNGTLVVNSGSAGTAFDGDARISYAQLVWRNGRWHGEIVRLDYDRDQARRDFENSEFRAMGGPLTEIFLQEWLCARPMVNRWSEQYDEHVVAGEIDLQLAVDAFLQAEL